jgi:ABC-type antimicrobial peptide transport system permease subunit
MVLRDALVHVGIGVAAGVPLTVGASRIIRNQLPDVAPTDPFAFGVSIGVLVLGALTAALLPALRASRVAPVVALRAE